MLQSKVFFIMWARIIGSIFGYVYLHNLTGHIGSLCVRYFNNLNGVKYAYQHFQTLIRRTNFWTEQLRCVDNSNSASVKEQ